MIVFHDCYKDNESVGVNEAIKDAGLKTVLIPSYNYMRIYCKTK